MSPVFPWFSLWRVKLVTLKLLNDVMVLVKNEPTACRLIRNLISCAQQYVAAVNLLEAELLLGDAEAAGYTGEIEALDQKRTLAHNGLIDAINICNRHLRSLLGDDMPPGGIYPEPSHISRGNRRAIGDWAGRLVFELFTARR